jgi:translation initiation factor 2 subunit 2
MDSDILPLIDFSKVFKKKKIIPSSHDLGSLNLNKKKKKEANKEIPTENEKEEEKKETNNTENNEEYTYEFLIDRIAKMLDQHNQGSDLKKNNLKISVPEIITIGKTKSAWVNFDKFVNALNRPHDHLLNYVLGELGVQGTIGGENQIIIKMKVNKKDIENILRKYIHDYVQCSNCKSFRTVIRKDPSTRLQKIYCESCFAEKTIQHLYKSVRAGK